MSHLLRRTLVITLLILVILAFILDQSFFQVNIIDPIARIVWLTFRLFRAIDQEVVWNVLIYITAMIVLLVIPSQPQKYHRRNYCDPAQTGNRVAHWEALIRSADRDEENQMILGNDLRNLAGSVVEYGSHVPDQPRATVRQSTKIQSYFPKKIKKYLPASVMKNKFADLELRASLDQTLETMECQMEMNSDQPSSDTKNP